MDKYLGTFKTTQTLYLDRDEGCWDIDKPEDFDKNDDVFLRKGSILKAYQLDNVEEYGWEIILEHANSSWFGFESIDSLYKYPYVYEVDRPVEVDERRTNNEKGL